ncbi:MAG: N-acetylmuramoyl-L-alanine amidase [Calditrichaceae bacterium]
MNVRFFSVLFIGLLVSSCAWIGSKEKVWTDLPDEYFATPVYAKYLQGFKVVIDPGHGGLSQIKDYKRGPSGLREAEVNLRVALYLQSFLEKAGVQVVLTRTNDVYVSLADRANIANTSGADFLISLHHNASANPNTNFVSVYYHIHPDLSPASMDIARNVYFGLVDALRLPQISPDGLHSDQQIYPAGFGLLRTTKIPAILCESSFHSNRREEKRLKDKEYNKREAYGIFLGLARYAKSGIPSARLAGKDSVSISKMPRLKLKVDDGLRNRNGRDSERLRLFSSLMDVRVDGRKVPFTFEPDSARITITVDSSLTNGKHAVDVDLVNLFKNSNLQRPINFIVSSPAKGIRFSIPTAAILADGISYLPVDVLFLDKDSQPVWDGVNFGFSNYGGSLETKQGLLRGGSARVYLHSTPFDSAMWLYAEADSAVDSLMIRFVSDGISIFQGEIRSLKAGTILPDAEIYACDSLLTRTDFDGRFFLTGMPQGNYTIRVQKRGYFPQETNIAIESDKTTLMNFDLREVEDGLFFDQSIVIDARHGGSEKGAGINDSMTASVYNFQVVKYLSEKLKFAGMTVYMVREDNSDLSVDDRIKRINKFPEGWYLRFGVTKATNLPDQIKATTYPGNMKGVDISDALLNEFKNSVYKISVEQNMDIPEIRNTNKAAVALDLQIVDFPPAEEMARWLYNGLKKYYKNQSENQKTLK